MSSQPYRWFEAYRAAASEHDFTRLYRRIDLALNAIDERFDGPAELDELEFNEIQAALRALHLLSIDEAVI